MGDEMRERLAQRLKALATFSADTGTFSIEAQDDLTADARSTAQPAQPFAVRDAALRALRGEP